MSARDDVLFAALDLVGRTGARELQIGYLHDDVPVDQAGWFATVLYRGVKVIEQDHRGPVEAAEALARRLMTGGQCRCGALVALSDAGAFAYGSARLLDGTPWDAETAAAAGQCRWTREGRRWYGACGAGR